MAAPQFTKAQKASIVIDGLVLILSAVTFFYWFSGHGLFYSENSPVLSPFTSLSIAMMTLVRVAGRHLHTWSKPMSLALLGLVACGNLTSIWVHWISPELFLKTIPELVTTSPMTSVGLILFCCYEILFVLRETPKTAFILDDILLHLALFPGGLSLLGHWLGVSAYTSNPMDPRVGISPLEMVLMASFTVAALLSNPNLFLWTFLKKGLSNKFIFALFFINQYVAAFLFGFFFRSPQTPTDQVGLEFYIMLAGVLTTLLFLTQQAISHNKTVQP